MSATNDNTRRGTTQYVTVSIGGQLFGLPIFEVHDVFVPDAITVVPLAQPEIAGLLNLRGRIVTVVDMRKRLALPPREGSATTMAVGIEYKGESYGLLIDEVGEVMTLPNADREPNPANLDRRWAEVAAGVHRLDGRLMVVLDVKRLLGRMTDSMAA